MSSVMEEAIKRWMRKGALVIEILQGKTKVVKGCDQRATGCT